MKKKVFYSLYSEIREFIYISKYKLLLKHFKIKCKNLWERPLVKHDFYNTNLGRNKTKQLLTLLSVDMRIYLPLKVIFT